MAKEEKDKPEVYAWFCVLCSTGGTASSQENADMALQLHVAGAHLEGDE